jgi:glycosyltransferase involved in cell wall biosynthesis
VTKEITVMMLTWEFPPRIVGGVSPHVLHLSRNLTRNGLKVYVVTCDFPGTPKRENIDGIEVLRTDSYRNPSPDFITWVYLMNMNMQIEAAELVSSLGVNVDLFHAHDWLVATAGIGLKHVFKKPLITTIHSTEIGRRKSINTDYERLIHDTEYWLTYESWKVICCSSYMEAHVSQTFSLPKDKLLMISNGVNFQEYEKYRNSDLSHFRRKFALPEEKIVLFVGRLVYEKGVHVLIKSLPNVLRKVNAKFVVVGEGYMKEQLSNLVRSMELAHKVLFTGFVDDETLMNLQRCADVCVVPSLFEPFGIVALEAMAAGCPIVVTDTGGLSEVVEHDVSGVKVYPDNSDSLAWGIVRILLDGNYANLLRIYAKDKLQEKYSWDTISLQTKDVYERVLKDYSKTYWAHPKTHLKNHT